MTPEKFYNENENYRRYVDSFAKSYGVSVEEAMTHKIIREQIFEYYLEREKNKVKEEEDAKNRQRFYNQTMQ